MVSHIIPPLTFQTRKPLGQGGRASNRRWGIKIYSICSPKVYDSNYQSLVVWKYQFTSIKYFNETDTFLPHTIIMLVLPRIFGHPRANSTIIILPTFKSIALRRNRPVNKAKHCQIAISTVCLESI